MTRKRKWHHPSRVQTSTELAAALAALENLPVGSSFVMVDLSGMPPRAQTTESGARGGLA